MQLILKIEFRSSFKYYSDVIEGSELFLFQEATDIWHNKI